MKKQQEQVVGVDADSESRCSHYHIKTDVVALKFYCCNVYYACRKCHDELANHLAQVWPKTMFQFKAIMCGVCKQEMTIQTYLACEDKCVHCGAKFNPGCHDHHQLYFEV